MVRRRTLYRQGHPWQRTMRQHNILFFRRMFALFSKASLHGVNRVCVSDTCCRPNQMVWMCILLIATLGLCVHIYSEAYEYQQYPVSSSSRMELNGFVFPSVTFCNPENPIKTREVNFSEIGGANDKIQVLSGVWYDPKVRPLYRYEHYMNFSRIGSFPQDSIIYCRYNRRTCWAENFTITFDRAYGNCFTFQPNERHIRRPDMEFGLILILYNPAADMELEKAGRVGKMGYKMRPQEMAFDTESFLVNFHASGTIPHPLENSYAASMGMVTTLALEQMNTSLVSTPNSPCQKRHQVPMYDSLLRRVTNYTDTLYDCARWRDTLNMHQACGCVPEGLVRLTDFPNKSAIPYCHLVVRPDEVGNKTEFINFVKPKLLVDQHNVSLEDMQALYPKVYNRYQSFVCYHNTDLHPDLTCQDMCQTESYSAILSSGRWPHPSDTDSDDYIKQAIEISILLQDYLNDHGNESLLAKSLTLRNLSLASCHTELTHVDIDTPNRRSTPKIQAALKNCRKVHAFVSKHFLLIKVYPQTLTVKFLTVERSFMMPQLLSRIGGSLGLWIGTSLITFFECLEIILTLVNYLVAKILHVALYHRDKNQPRCAGSCPYAGRQAQLRNGRSAIGAEAETEAADEVTDSASFANATASGSSGTAGIEATAGSYRRVKEDDGSAQDSDSDCVTEAFLDNLYRESHV